VRDVAELLEHARTVYATGPVAQALEACEEVAAAARAADDPAALADAATVIHTTPSTAVAGRVHALCTEALARLGDSDPVRSARVRAQLVLTTDPFHVSEPLDLPPESGDPESSFLRLQAWQAARLTVDHLPERMEVADAAVELGRRTGTDEYLFAGRRWRTDVHAVLGDRVDLAAELSALRPLAARSGRPAWRAHVMAVEASQRLLEGRYDDAVDLLQRAVQTEGDPDGESAALQVIVTSVVAQQTGRGAAESEAAVRELVDSMPYMARGWLCVVLRARDGREEAEALWWSIAPHVLRMPVRAPEWLIATVGNADVCAWLGDRETGARLYAELVPYSGLHAIAFAHSPYEGPVDLALGRLAVLADDRDAAARHLGSALHACEVLHALPHQALVLAELAQLAGHGTAGGQAHAGRARALASRLGMAPLLARMPAATGSRGLTAADRPLTPRELEITALVADGLSNAAIAERLILSLRTVEHHVSNVLRKLDMTSRAGMASWHASRGR